MAPGPPHRQLEQPETHSPLLRGYIPAECYGQTDRWLELDMFPSDFLMGFLAPLWHPPPVAAANSTLPKSHPSRVQSTTDVGVGGLASWTRPLSESMDP